MGQPPLSKNILTKDPGRGIRSSRVQELELEVPHRSLHVFRARDKSLTLGEKTRLMGVVNLTPDSFYDGGRFLRPEDALRRCLQLADEGADLLDLGGESTRPGAGRTGTDEELRRVAPVIESLRTKVSIPISIDTRKAAVARRALEAGADMVNDVSAFSDPEMPSLVAASGAGVVLMHMRGTPANMQQIPPSPDILADVEKRLAAALKTGNFHQIPHDRIILDPGIGFGKTVEDNLKILNRLAFLEKFRLPVLVGTSRKSFIGKILEVDAEDRLWGTAASVAVAVLRGAHIVRVHDVKEMRMVAAVTDALMAERVEP